MFSLSAVAAVAVRTVSHWRRHRKGTSLDVVIGVVQTALRLGKHGGSIVGGKLDSSGVSEGYAGSGKSVVGDGCVGGGSAP